MLLNHTYPYRRCGKISSSMLLNYLLTNLELKGKAQWPKIADSWTSLVLVNKSSEFGCDIIHGWSIGLKRNGQISSWKSWFNILPSWQWLSTSFDDVKLDLTSFFESFLNFTAQSFQEWNVGNHTIIILLVTELIKEFSNVILGNFIT